MLVKLQDDLINPITGEVIIKKDTSIELITLNTIMTLLDSFTSTQYKVDHILKVLDEGRISNDEALNLIRELF